MAAGAQPCEATKAAGVPLRQSGFSVASTLPEVEGCEEVIKSLSGWVFVVNPASASGRTGKKWPAMLKAFKDKALSKGWSHADDVRTVMTTRPNEGTELSRKSLREGARVIVAVGGDGSLAEVVEGFFEPGSHAKVSQTGMLAYVPNGTGGDFRKSLEWTDKYEDAIEKILMGNTRKVDVGHVLMCQGMPSEIGRHFLNISSCGSSALIAQIANSTPNLLGPTFTFYQASLRGLLQYQPRNLSIRVDQGDWQELKDVNCLAVCNGRYFGSGMMVAPSAELSDGLLDVTIWAGFGIIDFVLLTPIVYSGEHVKHAKTTVFRCKNIEVKDVTSTGVGSEVAVELDGETPGALPATFSVLPCALTLLA